MKMTHAQKVSKSVLTYVPAFHAQTTDSALERMNDSTNITRPCLPNTPESSPEKA